MITLTTFLKGQTLPANLTANANNSIWLANAVLSQYPQLVFTSGYRSPAKNASVGGVASSYHLTAQAFDFSGARLSAAQLTDLRRLMASYNYEIIDELDHYHFEPRNRNGFQDYGSIMINDNTKQAVLFAYNNPLPKPQNPQSDNTIYYALGGAILLLLILD